MARVLTDVAGIDKEFDYLIPAGQAGRAAAGAMVRVDLSGRRVGGWVTSVLEAGEGGLALRPLAKVRGAGPEPDLMDLAGWAAWRWAGTRSAFLTAASPHTAVTALPPPATRPPARPGRTPVAVPSEPGVHVLRLPPAADPTAVVAAAAQLGPTLVVVPAAGRAAVLAGRLRRAGGDVALLPDGWAQARAGAGVVVGARAAAWGPCPGLAAAVVLDAHDEALTQEGAPTWGAVAVVAERARRAGAPCLVVSACPPPELLALGAVRVPDRGAERAGWGTIEVVDRRADDPRLGLYSERLVHLVRAGGRVACVLNRTGRVRLLACAACAELVRCERCGAAAAQPEPARLQCPRCGLGRPGVCARCGSTRLKALRVGVGRARDDLERLAGRPVGEVTAATKTLPECDVLVGTEALLRRLDPGSGVAAVAFIDFDQELLAPRVRAADQALSLLALASRVVRGRVGRVLVQTRIPGHPVIRAAEMGDPGPAVEEETGWRRTLGLPPFSAVAVVHGEAAAEYVAALPPPLQAVGPDGDRWLVKAPDQPTLSDGLAAAARPAGKLRVAVEPARL